MSIATTLKTFFGHAAHGIGVAGNKIGVILGLLEDDAKTIEHYMEVALPIIKMVEAMAPNRVLEELIALGTKFQLHVTPEIAADPDQVETLLQNAALKELQKFAPSIPNSILRASITLAFRTLKTARNA